MPLPTCCAVLVSVSPHFDSMIVVTRLFFRPQYTCYNSSGDYRIRSTSPLFRRPIMLRHRKTALCDPPAGAASASCSFWFQIGVCILSLLVGLQKYCLGFRESCTTVRATAASFNLVLAPRLSCCRYYFEEVSTHFSAAPKSLRWIMGLSFGRQLTPFLNTAARPL
jgi:hypothetical protein